MNEWVFLNIDELFTISEKMQQRECKWTLRSWVFDVLNVFSSRTQHIEEKLAEIKIELPIPPFRFWRKCHLKWIPKMSSTFSLERNPQVIFAENPSLKTTNFSERNHGYRYLIHCRPDNAFNSTVANRICLSWYEITVFINTKYVTNLVIPNLLATFSAVMPMW